MQCLNSLNFFQSCEVIQTPSVQPSFVYLFLSAQRYSINFDRDIKKFSVRLRLLLSRKTRQVRFLKNKGSKRHHTILRKLKTLWLIFVAELKSLQTHLTSEHLMILFNEHDEYFESCKEIIKKWTKPSFILHVSLLSIGCCPPESLFQLLWYKIRAMDVFLEFHILQKNMLYQRVRPNPSQPIAWIQCYCFSQPHVVR